jgi:glyceraldehyde 3-phosphate dehydrogenase
MAKIKIGINGMGRIGRTLVRALINRHQRQQDLDFEIVGVNNPGDPEPYVHLLNFDSLHGKMCPEAELKNGKLLINNQEIFFTGFKSPSEIPWDQWGAQIVIDATGKFKDKAALSAHIKGSVKKVIMCAPGKDLDGTFVMGINHHLFDPSKHHVVSNASCTTNCLAPIVKVLNDNFGIENGFMTTVHAYTSDQNLLDNSHSDLRRARAAAVSMIPTSTGAAKALGEVIPEMTGKLDGYAVRVPTPDVSMVDLTVNLTKACDKKTLNAAMKAASESALKNILGYTEKELVSIDFMGRTESSIFDAKLTNVIGKTAKVVSWYDNEVGFSHRVLDLAYYIGKKSI